MGRPNHLHLLLRTGEESISRVMRRLLTGYAVSFKRRHKRLGHLFQNRYKSILVGEDPYFLQLVRYIHVNPLRAGLVEDVSELDNWPWRISLPELRLRPFLLSLLVRQNFYLELADNIQ